VTDTVPAVPAYDDAAPAIDPNVPPALAAAIVAAYADLDNLKKNKTANVGTYSYDFSDLADLMEMARPVLARHGLALLQPITRRGGGPVEVDTWLLHRSGHMLRWTFETPATGNPQATGSAITYARRYSAQAALGVASEGQDDDGKAAATQTVTPPRHTRPKAQSVPDEERSRATRHAMVLFDQLGYGDRSDRLRLTSEILGREVESWNDTSQVERARIISELQVRLDEEADGRALAHDVELDRAEEP